MLHAILHYFEVFGPFFWSGYWAGLNSISQAEKEIITDYVDQWNFLKRMESQ